MGAYGKKLAAAGFLLFLSLWAAGFVRGFTLPRPDLPSLPVSSVSYSSEDYRREGARTANNLKQIGFHEAPLPQVLDQEDVNKIRVFEKTAQLAAGTAAFPDDEGRVRRGVADARATVFSERASGVAPDRTLALGIAVHPDRFDALLREMSSVGHLGSILVQQQDRTGEFRRLHAQRQSLRKHQDALLKLRGAKNLTVEEALKVEQKVLEVEKEAESVGVQLGGLLGGEPSYNLFVTLQEYQPGDRHDPGVGLAGRLGAAFLWALGWWLVAALALTLAAGAYVSVRTLYPARRQPAGG
jgi:hypothetical protein